MHPLRPPGPDPDPNTPGQLHQRDTTGQPFQQVDEGLPLQFGGLNISNPSSPMQGYQPGYRPFQPLSSFPSPYVPQYSSIPYNVDPMGAAQSYHVGGSQHPFPPSAWSSPALSPAAQQQPFMRHARHGSLVDTNPVPYSPYFPPTNFPQPGQSSQWKPTRAVNRRSWSGPAQPQDQERERKAYHPQAPARRSDWVMWVGNVPQNTSHEELWRFFNHPIPGNDVPWRGPSSIFLISRSSCAFVNLSSQDDLDKAVTFFNGKPLRPWDPRCPRMVCRVRRKDDDLRSGVGAQRGTGMHRDWIKLQDGQTVNVEPTSPVVAEAPPEGDGRRRESVVEVPTKHQSSASYASYASTNSSFLTRHFPLRVFILKSLTTGELEDSAKTSTWRTQRHNEAILDQAFRTSQEVFLIFGANRAGEFFGYAKMVEPIDKEKAKKQSDSSKGDSSKGSVHPPEAVQEEVEDVVDDDKEKTAPTRPELILSTSQTRVASDSPAPLTPTEEATLAQAAKSHTHPIKTKTEKTLAAVARANTLDSRFQVRPPTVADKPDPQPPEINDDPPKPDNDGVVRKDTLPKNARKEQQPEGADDELGLTFNLQWIKVGPLGFHRIRHLRNPWNADREVKVSRDGTEVEPAIGAQLMAEWDKLPVSAVPTYASVQNAE